MQFVDFELTCKTWLNGKNLWEIWEASPDEIQDIAGVKNDLFDLLVSTVVINPMELASRVYNAFQILFGRDNRFPVINFAVLCVDRTALVRNSDKVDLVTLRRFGLLLFGTISRVSFKLCDLTSIDHDLNSVF